MSTELEVDVKNEPVAIAEEDFQELHKLQSQVDQLDKYRREMGRVVQLLGNLREEANKIEESLATNRRALANKYDLEKHGTGQWALDFEKKEFVKTAAGTPVIP